MEIIIYKNNDDDRVVTKNISTLTTLTGTLREDCSIIDPVIKVEGMTNAIAAAANYAKIADFGRYYFIKDIIFTGNLFEIHMHVDVISSFQTELKNLEAVIARQENKYNLYLQDGLFRTYQNPKIQVKAFPSGFNGYHYVMPVAGA